MLQDMLQDGANQTSINMREHFMSKLIMALMFVVLVAVTGGFVALAAWDVPVSQTPVEKTLDAAHYLN